jgi:SPP1 family predicted phage head-tail adaptor
MTMFQINAGKYRHKIQIQKLVSSQDEYGETDNHWQTIVTTKAGIFPISGREFYAAQEVQSEMTHKIQTRYIKGISSDMRILFDGRVFNIISPPINWQEKNRELQFNCKEIFNG